MHRILMPILALVFVTGCDRAEDQELPTGDKVEVMRTRKVEAARDDPHVWKATPEELASVRTSVSVAVVSGQDTDGFIRHGTKGTRSAFYTRDRQEVRVVDTSRKDMISITGFPRKHGWVCATGWTDDRGFYVHLSPGADRGTMIYMDITIRKVVAMEHWGGW